MTGKTFTLGSRSSVSMYATAQLVVPRSMPIIKRGASDFGADAIIRNKSCKGGVALQLGTPSLGTQGPLGLGHPASMSLDRRVRKSSSQVRRGLGTED